MRPLDGPDLFHLIQERANRPMHTLKVAVLERSISCDAFDTWACDTLTGVEVLRLKLAKVPFAHPVWIDGGAPELAYHVQHVTLEPPGGEPELIAVLDHMCGDQPLDRGRPLWRVWHVCGLQGDRDALVFQLHHALADGNASVSLLEAIAADRSPACTAQSSPTRPSPFALGAHAFGRGGRELARLPSQVRRFVAYMRAARARERAGEPAVTKAFVGPSTRFNGEPEPDRRCAFVTMPLERLRDIRTATGATLTEVFATVVGGGLARFLDEQGEAPDGTLTATIPAALPERRHTFGNSVTTLYASLYSDVRDPLARLDEVRRSLGTTRQSSERDPRLLADWQRYPRLNATLIKLMEFAETRARRPAYNLTVSSVRGPKPLAIAGIPVVEVRSLGPLVGHFGLNVTGWSYGGDFTVGIHAYASAGDELERLGPLMLDELTRLEQAVSPAGVMR